MIRLPPINPKSSIHLLHQNQSHQLMRKRHFRKGQGIIRSLHHLITQSKRSANDKRHFTLSIGSKTVEIRCKLLGWFHFPFDRQRYDMGVIGNFWKDAFSFFLFHHFHFGIAEVFGCFFVREFDDVDFGVWCESLQEFVDSLFQVFFF